MSVLVYQGYVEEENSFFIDLARTNLKKMSRMKLKIFVCMNLGLERLLEI